MKKPKKIKKYEADGYIFNTFQELKNYVYFNTSIKMKNIVTGKQIGRAHV